MDIREYGERYFSKSLGKTYLSYKNIKGEYISNTDMDLDWILIKPHVKIRFIKLKNTERIIVLIKNKLYDSKVKVDGLNIEEFYTNYKRTSYKNDLKELFKSIPHNICKDIIDLNLYIDSKKEFIKDNLPYDIPFIDDIIFNIRDILNIEYINIEYNKDKSIEIKDTIIIPYNMSIDISKIEREHKLVIDKNDNLFIILRK